MGDRGGLRWRNTVVRYHCHSQLRSLQRFFVAKLVKGFGYDKTSNAPTESLDDFRFRDDLCDRSA
jgi:hypothetical protein